jgi:hypothetical protein
MVTETTQTAIITGLFAVLGGASTFLWLGHGGRLVTHSLKWVALPELAWEIWQAELDSAA